MLLARLGNDRQHGRCGSLIKYQLALRCNGHNFCYLLGQNIYFFPPLCQHTLQSYPEESSFSWKATAELALRRYGTTSCHPVIRAIMLWQPDHISATHIESLMGGTNCSAPSPLVTQFPPPKPL
jgi:hypothetical protein